MTAPHPQSEPVMTRAEAAALHRCTPLSPCPPVVKFSPRPVPSPDGIAQATDEQLLALAAANGVLGLDRWLADLAADEIEARGLVVPRDEGAWL